MATQVNCWYWCARKVINLSVSAETGIRKAYDHRTSRCYDTLVDKQFVIDAWGVVQKITESISRGNMSEHQLAMYMAGTAAGWRLWKKVYRNHEVSNGIINVSSDEDGLRESWEKTQRMLEKRVTT